MEGRERLPVGAEHEPLKSVRPEPFDAARGGAQDKLRHKGRSRGTSSEASSLPQPVSRLRSTQTGKEAAGKVDLSTPPANTLDGSWDRQITRGRIEPDYTVDLHGHTLESAWQMLDSSLARAITGGDRVILLITGKPPRHDRPGRGAIRARVKDWLAHSRHARSIAAVRGAHPKHGGTGALYIVLRRFERR